MRTGIGNAQSTANTFTCAIINYGTVVPVTPGPSNPLGQTQIRYLPCIMEAPDAEAVQRLQLEGAWNAADGSAYTCTFTEGSLVQANDTFLFNNFTYRLLTAYPQPYADATLGIRCIALRTGKGKTV